jgi:hypothetical protein
MLLCGDPLVFKLCSKYTSLEIMGVVEVIHQFWRSHSNSSLIGYAATLVRALKNLMDCGPLRVILIVSFSTQ